MTKFNDPKPILKELEQKLLEQFKATNTKISLGQNPYVKLTRHC